MSLSRRQELVRLARKYDALLIADDVYDFVYWKSYASVSENASLPHYPLSSSLSASSSSSSSSYSSSISGSPAEFTSLMPRLVDIDATLDGGPIDNFGNCVSNGSFSKIVGPGCRVGWAEGTPAFIYGLSQV
jgi:DNA-binding transcriptional MocR family regulator